MSQAMNQDLHYLQKPFITVGAIFQDDISISDILNDNIDTQEHHGHCYTFKAEVDSGLVVGDFAVVHANDALKIVKIVQVHATPNIDINARYEYKWVVQKIDFTAFKTRHKEQKGINDMLTALEIAERQEALMARLDKMSAKDSTFATLLQKLQDSTGISLLSNKKHDA